MVVVESVHGNRLYVECGSKLESVSGSGQESSNG